MAAPKFNDPVPAPASAPAGGAPKFEAPATQPPSNLPPGIKDNGPGVSVIPKDKRVLSPHDLPNVGDKKDLGVSWFVKDPTTELIYDADSSKGTQLILGGATPYSLPNQEPSPAPGRATSESGGFFEQGVEHIRSMQKELIQLSKDMLTHDLQHTAPVKIGPDDTLQGADPFMNFLVTNYMSKKPSGKTLVNVDEKLPVRMQAGATENANLKGVLGSLAHIGAPGAPSKPDGAWGERTNNALLQAYALAYALMQVQRDMDKHIDVYKDSDLAELHANTPQDPAALKVLNFNEKVKRAGILAINIAKLRNLYDTFRHNVLDDPNYAAHIVQEKALFTQKAPQIPKAALSEYDQKLYNDNSGEQIDVMLNGHKVMIMPFDLKTIDNFKKYVNKNMAQLGLASSDLHNVETYNALLIDLSNSLGAQ